jgi:hypothetical protein
MSDVMNGRDIHRLRFYQEELFEAKNKLFKAKSVKQVKFLQDRINFLLSKIEEIENGGRN